MLRPHSRRAPAMAHASADSRRTTAASSRPSSSPATRGCRRACASGCSANGPRTSRRSCGHPTKAWRASNRVGPGSCCGACASPSSGCHRPRPALIGSPGRARRRRVDAWLHCTKPRYRAAPGCGIFGRTEYAGRPHGHQGQRRRNATRRGRPPGGLGGRELHRRGVQGQLPLGPAAPVPGPVGRGQEDRRRLHREDPPGDREAHRSRGRSTRTASIPARRSRRWRRSGSSA